LETYLIISALNAVGETTISFCTELGKFSLFLYNALRASFRLRISLKKVCSHMNTIGIHSLAISIITGTFAGAVLAYQMHEGFKKFGGQNLLGAIVALSMIRELGPVLTGLMVTGRAGSSIAAEIGTMRISEQLDALKTLGIDPFQYLIIPRIIGATCIMPFLTIFSMFAGIVGGYVVALCALGIPPDAYISHIKELVTPFDVVGGAIKGAIFGFIFSTVGCYQGYHARDGARGVGMATTQSVVMGSIIIIISNYFLALILFGT
jgi:phospholipid/cholesterol/gamma-HCH transport system permease protein